MMKVKINFLPPYKDVTSKNHKQETTTFQGWSNRTHEYLDISSLVNAEYDSKAIYDTPVA